MQNVLHLCKFEGHKRKSIVASFSQATMQIVTGLPLLFLQSPSETTGEHTLVMLCALEHHEVEGGTQWLQPFVTDFKVRSSTAVLQWRV